MQGVSGLLKIIHMTVNGNDVEVAIDPRESLLDTLRGRLGLTSVKKGCEVGECGACTVLVDGEAIDSCIYLTVWAEGRRIMTVEGLKGPNGELSPIQKAFIEEAAVQCGFCTPGLIMSVLHGPHGVREVPISAWYAGPDYVRGGNRGHRKALQPG